MEITLSQQYNVGEEPTVILYTYINRHAGTLEKSSKNKTEAMEYTITHGSNNILLVPVAPVAQRYHVTSDTLGREFDPGKRDFSH